MVQFNFKLYGSVSMLALFVLLFLQTGCSTHFKQTLEEPRTPSPKTSPKKIVSDKQITATIKLFHEAVSKGKPRDVQRYLEHISFLPQSKQKQVLNSLSDNTTVIYKAIERCGEMYNPTWDQQILLGLARHSLIDINETGKKRLSSLILALQQDNPKAAQILLNKSDGKGLNVTDTDPDTRNTPLHLAIAKGYDDISKTLLAYNIDINAKNKYQNTPLHLAILNGSQNIIKRLVASKGIDINAKDANGYSPLYIAALYGNASIMKILLTAEKIDVNEKDTDGNNALHIATSRGDKSMVDALMASERANINAKNEKGYTPLHIATSRGDKNMVDTLMASERVNVNAKDEKGYTPLHIATLRGDKNIIYDLLQSAKVEINAADKKGYTPLHIATLYCDKDIVAALAKAYSTLVIDKKNRHIDTSLNKDPRTLLAINQKNIYGNTPLHLATIYRDKDIVKILVDTPGILLNEKDSNGNSPLYVAILHLRKDVFKVLVEADEIELDKENEYYYTPFRLAMASGDKEIIETLINAYNTKQKKSKKTPLESADAKEQDCSELVKPCKFKRALFREWL